MACSGHIDTDVLVVGAGPAGAALAAFLGAQGIRGLVVSRSNSTVVTPRAHYTTPPTIECLRDIGLEYAAKRIGHSREEVTGNVRICETYVGRELLRDLGPFYSHPDKMAEHWVNTPCQGLDLPQTELEPLLLRHATQNGFMLRYNTEMISFEDDEGADVVRSELRDTVTDTKLTVTSKFLCGADGANSRIAKALGLDFVAGESTGGMATNVLFEANLSSTMNTNHRGLLNVCLGGEEEQPDFGVIGVNRVVKPFERFLMILAAAPHVSELAASEADIVARTKQLLGCDPPDFKLLSVSSWRVRHEHAKKECSRGNVFCLGDAIHRHPPNNGLGSNTCVQDAYNLAWKLAFVLKGKADKTLLESFSLERQPVAAQVVTQANSTRMKQRALYEHLGAFQPTPSARLSHRALWSSPTAEGLQYRQQLRKLHDDIRCEFHGVGTEFNQQYVSSTAVCIDENVGSRPHFTSDPHFIYQRSTYPGFRVPHAWLSATRLGDFISTQDLCGHGRFVLLTGIGGKSAWQAAATEAGLQVPGGLEIDVHSIGHGQDFEDVYWMWEDIRSVEENGAILVRPDRWVGWRCVSSQGQDPSQLATKLSHALSIILYGKSSS